MPQLSSGLQLFIFFQGSQQHLKLNTAWVAPNFFCVLKDMCHHVWSSFSLTLPLFSPPPWWSYWPKAMETVNCRVKIQISVCLFPSYWDLAFLAHSDMQRQTRPALSFWRTWNNVRRKYFITLMIYDRSLKTVIVSSCLPIRISLLVNFVTAWYRLKSSESVSP